VYKFYHFITFQHSFIHVETLKLHVLRILHLWNTSLKVFPKGYLKSTHKQNKIFRNSGG